MQYKSVLEQLGFAPSEIAVYTALLELDSGAVVEIAKKSGINRTSCYDVLENLIKKGLVSKFKKKKKIYFTAGDPRRLIGYLDREKEEAHKKIERQKDQVKEIMPELVSLLHPQSTKPKVSFFEGEKGMREAYEDTLTANKIYHAYANVETMHEGLPDFFPEYYQRRTQAGILGLEIFPNNPGSVERASHNKEELRENVYLPDGMTFTPEVIIYNNKVLVASWKEKMAVIIESKELADLQRMIHVLLWKYLKKS